MNDMTFETLLRGVLAFDVRLDTPIRVIHHVDKPWVSAIAGVAVVDGVILLVLGDDLDPATAEEIDARDDLLGAP